MTSPNADGDPPPHRRANDARPDLHAQLNAKRAEIEERVRSTRADLEGRVTDVRTQFDQANERVEARVGRNLLMATAIGVALVVTLVVSLFFLKELFVLFGAAVVVFTSLELATALQHADRRTDRWPAAGAGLVFVAAAYFTDGPTRWAVMIAAVTFVVVWRLIAQMAAADGRAPLEVVLDIAAAVFTQAYIAGLGSFAVILVARDGGELWVFAFIALVIVVDVGAYASGLSLGRHAMAPRVSPNKTWEGFAGAVLLSQVAGVLFALYLLEQPWWVGMIFGAVIVLSATIGDLSESMIKRDIGIKDMSSWLPGHGGFLDRLDSILPSAPVAYLLFVIFA
ncbi:phosphatidate cytidylyltransferase [Labedella phragmitis]|uniref:Phosphatidate cytidylyltransferase n=1 Tax=Labedella phragmitis TaxID=2498849 RepID=A0A3S4DHT9_9MICO|nr:phosphatidate cytidylyltransferase [Labedella phragmitis]RWZ51950.1 phosphatidate cytidylyltransferase [Labedella phragmitis]